MSQWPYKSFSSWNVHFIFGHVTARLSFSVVHQALPFKFGKEIPRICKNKREDIGLQVSAALIVVIAL